ncbi:unnamed protein product [Lymnaea stagnalis]|uniref:Ig-like domain-containing protein n=1 Tax=Lymnaea stagnalis TaxID=6523 RepID=A0AAV2I4F4_LYMST
MTLSDASTMERFQILPVLALGLHLICGLSALDCNDLKWRENPVDVFEVKANFALDCGKNSAPDLKYTWTKEDKPVIESSTVKSRGPTVQFLNFSESDEGLYKCYGLSPHSKGLDTKTLLRTIRLRQPRLTKFIRKGKEDHTVREYDYVRLDCSDKGVIIGDTFDYNWYRNFIVQIPHESERMYTDLTGNLHITPVLSEDERFGGKPAKFYCGVTDMWKLKLGYYGNDNYLTVKKVPVASQSKPILKHKSEHATAPLYKTAKLECVFSGYHPKVGMSVKQLVPTERFTRGADWGLGIPEIQVVVQQQETVHIRRQRK